MWGGGVKRRKEPRTTLQTKPQTGYRQGPHPSPQKDARAPRLFLPQGGSQGPATNCGIYVKGLQKTHIISPLVLIVSCTVGNYSILHFKDGGVHHDHVSYINTKISMLKFNIFYISKVDQVESM